jgi:NADPH:quinone reductase-like Zn-dependent oxidoreductase
VRYGGLRAGERVLIQAAAGGVGIGKVVLAP